jgi:histidinol-phosphate aminotransferase
MSPARTLGRPEWAGLELYRPVQAAVAINLSDNTSRFGMPPAARAVLEELAGDAVTRYPDAYAEPLKQALARHAGVAPAEIATGCGSDDILDSAFRAFGRPGERLAHLSPTFPMAEWFARLNGLEPVTASLAPDGRFDPDALLAGDPAITYLCSPNNPTGAALDPDAVGRVIERANGVVIVDEAYAEFADGPHWLARAPRTRGLIVTRTLSKAFGLAGLRVGWACGAADLVNEVERSRGPFKLNAVAERAATAALTRDVGWMREQAAEAVRMRVRLAAELRRRGFATLPSQANFVLVPLPGAPKIAAAMRALGVAVRPFESLPGIGDALRITAAPWPELERALEALEEAARCA